MIPPTQATLRLFQLSHGFLQRCRQYFREFLQLNSNLFPPLQVPASPILEVKSHTLEHYLFTFRQFLRQWTPDSSPTCVCHRIRPDLTRRPDSGHVIGFASEISPGLLLSAANLQDTVWPDERDYLNHSVTQMDDGLVPGTFPLDFKSNGNTYSGKNHLSLSLPPPPAQDLHSLTYHFHTRFPPTTTWYFIGIAAYLPRTKTLS